MKADILLLTVFCIAVAACSTTRLVPEGQLRLASNKVEVEGNHELSPTEISGYIKQQTGSTFIGRWNPFLNIYNWSDGSGKGLNKLWEKIGTPPVIFNPSLLKSSKENIGNHLDYLGYYGSTVTASIDTVRKLAHVKFNVRPGKRYSIRKIEFEVPEGEFAEEFAADSANIKIKIGDYLSEESLEAESSRSVAYFRNLGYYDFNKNNFKFEADTLNGSTTLYYRINGTPVKSHFRKVSISHPADVPFRESFLKSLNTVRPGMCYSEDLVNTTYSRLSSLKVFSGVSVELTPVDSTSLDCEIKLTGSGVKGFKINLEGSTNSSGLMGISPQISYYHKNIFHGGEWLSVGFSGNWQSIPKRKVRSDEFGVNASISFPQLLGFPTRLLTGAFIPRTEVKTSFNYQNRPEYKRSIFSFSYGYTGQLGKEFFYQAYPLEINLIKMPYLSEQFAQEIYLNPYLWDMFNDNIELGVGGMFYHTTNSDIVPKTSYHYSRFSFDLAGNLLSLFDKYMPYDPTLGKHMFLGSPYVQFVRGEIVLGNTLRFGRDDSQALAMRLDIGAGHAFGNSYAMPFEQQFFCGGASSMRGWQARMLGPGFESKNDFFLIPSQVGDFKFEADLEYRFKMFWKFEGALFAEAGNVWKTQITSFKNIAGSLAADWGAGLRIDLDFILLRLDAGFRLRDPALPENERWLRPEDWFRQDGYAIHFGIGYPF